MKLWFVEPRPNVFVSGIKDAIAKRVIAYLHKHCPPDSGLLIFSQQNTTPGYHIYGLGDPKRQLIDISGLQLVKEKSV
jgi:CRISPR-associated protein Cas2